MALSHVSNALGTVNPIKDMIALAKEHAAPVLIFRGAKEIGKIRWGEVSARSQYTLILLAVSFTWLMGLMGFVRSSLRQHWHVYEVMKDTTAQAYTPAIGYATVMVTAVVVLFFALVSVIFWISTLGAHDEVEEAAPEAAPVAVPAAEPIFGLIPRPRSGAPRRGPA